MSARESFLAAVSLVRGAARAMPRFFKAMLWALPALVLRCSSYRFVMVYGRRIGPLAMQVDYFLKKRALGGYGGYAGIRPIILEKHRRVSNPPLLRIWSRHVSVITKGLAYELMNPLRIFPFLCIDMTAASRGLVGKACEYQEIANQWGDRPPIFMLPQELLAEGHRTLRAMGVPEGAWFVPVHSRDGRSYWPSEAETTAYRDSDISSYSLAVDAIIARGGWCIRMGEKGTKPLVGRPGVVNYPDTLYKSDWMDLYLCNQARFFLGNTSGLKLVSTISGVPCALANIAPYECIYGFLPSDISIPKLLHLDDGRMPRFAEIFESDLANRSRFEKPPMLSDNTPEQIRDLAIEMLDVLEGKAQRTAEDEARQDSFRRLLVPRHYSYGARSRIGTSFLREYADLL